MIYLDFDMVIADLHSEWLRRYNESMGTEYTTRDVTHWDFMGQVENPELMWSILREPFLYEGVEPIDGALESIDAIRTMGIPFRIVSSCGSSAMIGGKLRWLRRHKLWMGADHTWPSLFIPIRDKHLLIGDLLVDDYEGNLANFQGRRVLFDQPHNQKAAVVTHDWRSPDWQDVLVQIATVNRACMA